jgi:hypothetical protein
LEPDVELWVEHVDEPERLILAWQAPDNHPDRLRWAVGELVNTGEGVRFRYFDADEIRSFNNSRERGELEAAGYLGYPAFDPATNTAVWFDDGVLDAFLRRLPPRDRSDFPRYLEHFRLKPSNDLSPLALLGATEARLPGDGFSLIDPLDRRSRYRELVFEVAGHRYNAQARDRLSVGQEVRLVAEPKNPHDANAIRIEAAGELIGHVNRLQAPTVGCWLKERDVSAWLSRLNGTPEKPRAFVFVRVRPIAGRRAA